MACPCTPMAKLAATLHFILALQIQQTRLNGDLDSLDVCSGVVVVSAARRVVLPCRAVGVAGDDRPRIGVGLEFDVDGEIVC